MMVFQDRLIIREKMLLEIWVEDLKGRPMDQSEIQ